MALLNQSLRQSNMLVQHVIYRLLVIALRGISSTTCAQKQKDEDLFDLPLTQLVNVKAQSASRFMQKSSKAPSFLLKREF